MYKSFINPTTDTPTSEILRRVMDQLNQAYEGRGYAYRKNEQVTLIHPTLEHGRIKDNNEKFLEAIEETISAAESFVDITTLQHISGRFEQAIVDSLNQAARKNRSKKPITVRITQGITAYYFSPVVPGLPSVSNFQTIQRALERGIDEKYRQNLVVYFVQDKTLSPLNFPDTFGWNHSKIVAVDGNQVVTGGHNMWEESYLNDTPVHDISLILKGESAIDAHHFVNDIWTGGTYSSYHPWNFAEEKLPVPVFSEADVVPKHRGGNLEAIALGQLTNGFGVSPIKASVLSFIATAKKSIYISQQELVAVIRPLRELPFKNLDTWLFENIGTSNSYQRELLRALGQKAIEKVKVNILTSNVGATASTVAKYNPDEVKRIIWAYVEDQSEENRRLFEENLTVG
ncbi:MAG: phospholipase D-like domain-containing protein, partial [Bacteroidota bacterium]